MGRSCNTIALRIRDPVRRTTFPVWSNTCWRKRGLGRCYHCLLDNPSSRLKAVAQHIAAAARAKLQEMGARSGSKPITLTHDVENIAKHRAEGQEPTGEIPGPARQGAGDVMA